MRTIATLAFSFLASCNAAWAMQSTAVTVYRCIDAKGHVTLGDAPCPTGTKEEVRTMQRPQDAPPRQVPAPDVPAAVPVAAPTPPPPHVIVMRTPQPMYECTTPDGERYTSDTGDGNPRWVPLWTLGYHSRWRTHGSPGPGNVATQQLNAYQAGRPLGGRVGAPTNPRPSPAPVTPPERPRSPGHQRPPPYGSAGGGTWVRDTCHALPQAEVCSRLADRREVIRRRFFNAQETERNELRREERGINARLAADCG